jgi:hypothetical protein
MTDLDASKSSMSNSAELSSSLLESKASSVESSDQISVVSISACRLCTNQPSAVYCDQCQAGFCGQFEPAF